MSSKNFHLVQNILCDTSDVRIKQALLLKIDEYKRATGVGYREIQKRAGIKSASTLSSYKAGRTNISDEQIENLCRVIGIRWQDLDVRIDVKRNPKLETLKARLDTIRDDEGLIAMVETMVNAVLDADSTKSRKKK